MKKGLLIYNPEDFTKNQWFVNELITTAPHHGLTLHLVLHHHLALFIDALGHFKASSTEFPLLEDYDFVINRTRDPLLGSHFEKMGLRVFNTSYVTDLCNHKGKTHSFLNSQGIPSVATFLGHTQYFNPHLIPFNYPMVLKSTGGHGGDEVYLLHDEASLLSYLDRLPSPEFILQPLCPHPGTDIRVFTLGQEIVGAIKRHSDSSFKSNYSLGGTANAYTLKPEERELVTTILQLLQPDFVGIDFILGEDGTFLFNEVEDVVGTRTLYLNYPELNIVDHFLGYIQNCLSTSAH